VRKGYKVTTKGRKEGRRKYKSMEVRSKKGRKKETKERRR
jgi:hypothetical protein